MVGLEIEKDLFLKANEGTESGIGHFKIIFLIKQGQGERTIEKQLFTTRLQCLSKICNRGN